MWRYAATPVYSSAGCTWKCNGGRRVPGSGVANRTEETAMPRMFRHLQFDERCQILALHQWGASVSAATAQLHKDKSTVCRELRRTGGRGWIQGCRDTSECPVIVDSKQRRRDCEADTIIGKAHQGPAVTLVERKSKYRVSQTVRPKAAILPGDAMQEQLRS